MAPLSFSRPKQYLASFTVRVFIQFPVLLLASCDGYGGICNSERDRWVVTPKTALPEAKRRPFAAHPIAA